MIILKSKKIKIIIILILILIMLKDIFIKLIKKFEISNLNGYKVLRISNLTNILNNYIKNDTILIFENNNWHYECTPGYSKYFIELGYKVDIIMHSGNQDTFYFFEPIEKIKIFIYNKLEEINNNSEKLRLLFNNYSYILIQTTDKCRTELYEKLGFFKMNKSIFVLHNILTAKYMGISNYFKQNRLWCLGNFKNALQVNPHYFGNIKLKDKSSKTRFFITSSGGRNYNLLISAANKLKKQNLDFEILVIGWTSIFSSYRIPKNLKENFIFKYKVSYHQLYQAVESCDYILIILDPNNRKDNLYKQFLASGSAQLTYGFSKPDLINKYFAHIYGMNSENSFLYENYNFYNSMYDAINLNNRDYKKKQYNLIKLSNIIYERSLKNLQKTLKTIKGLKINKNFIY